MSCWITALFSFIDLLGLRNKALEHAAPTTVTWNADGFAPPIDHLTWVERKKLAALHHRYHQKSLRYSLDIHGNVQITERAGRPLRNHCDDVQRLRSEDDDTRVSDRRVRDRINFRGLSTPHDQQPSLMVNFSMMIKSGIFSQSAVCFVVRASTHLS